MKAYLITPILSSLVIAVLTVIPGEIASAQSLPDIRRQYFENNLAISDLQQKKWKELLESVRVEPVEPLGKGLAERLLRDWQREQEARKEREQLIKQLVSPPKKPVIWTYTPPPFQIRVPLSPKHDPVQRPSELSSASRLRESLLRDSHRQWETEFNRQWRELDRQAAYRQNEAAARRQFQSWRRYDSPVRKY
jgi:hypothetical protein